jgi:hypothetical protein
MVLNDARKYVNGPRLAVSDESLFLNLLKRIAATPHLV